MLLNANPKRLAIYCFYDKDGIVDEYNIYLLEDLLKNITDLYIICNGKLTQEGEEKFLKLTKNVVVRENTQLDFGAYKKGMELVGYENLSNYDEVILLNDTVFGPLYPFAEMFEVMAKKDIDFWGITTHQKVYSDPFGTIPYGYIPKHIQSYFTVYRKNLLKSKEFKDHFIKMPEFKTYNDCVGKHEVVFCKKFEDLGFKWDVYANTDDWPNNIVQAIKSHEKELIELKRCPVIKRRFFYFDYGDTLRLSSGHEVFEALKFLKHSSEITYNTSLIWKHILRLYNLADIKYNTHLNYVLSTEHSSTDITNNLKVGLILHIYFEDMIDYCFKYACSMPEYADIFITTMSVKNKKLIEDRFSSLKNNVTVKVIENKGRDIASLLIASADFVKQHDLLCFAHGKKSSYFDFASIAQSWTYKCFENLLGSKEFVNNVINQFNQEECLGILEPSPPNHSVYYPTLSNSIWGPNAEPTKNLSKRLGLNVDIDILKEPISPMGSMFWFRSDALEPLYKYGFTIKDLPKEPLANDGTLSHAIERIHSFCAQSKGYYVGWLFSDSFAKIEITNIHYMLRKLNVALFEKYGAADFDGLLKRIDKKPIGYGLSKKDQLRVRLIVFLNRCPRFIQKPLRFGLKIYRKVRYGA